MGGKTGTAQVRRITAAMRAQGIKNETLPWRWRHHALFVGYGPVEAPRYVTAVIVEHGVGGAKAAAPIARDILLAIQKRAPHRIHTVDEAVEAAAASGEAPKKPAPRNKRKKRQ